MRICVQCELPIPIEVKDVYCSRRCFDEAIDAAIAADLAATPATSMADLSKYFDEPILLTKIKFKDCKVRRRLCDLRDDAEKRVENIDSYDTNKLLLTRTYFQSRADVLNDLLMMLAATSNTSCSCC